MPVGTAHSRGHLRQRHSGTGTGRGRAEQQQPAGRRADPGSAWLRGAVWFAFGSADRGTVLLGAAVAALILSIAVPTGPLLLGATVLLLIIADQTARNSAA
jgi:hypothetical protein